MYTTINGKKYIVGKLHYREYLHTSMGIYPYYLVKLEKAEGDYYKATYKHKDGDTITRIVTLF